jgi:hypothetical protein
MRCLSISLILLLNLAVQGVAVQAIDPGAESPEKAMALVGNWRLKFVLVGGSEKNLVFEARDEGHGSFWLLDTAPNDKPVASARPAVWSLISNRVSISSEVELPIGTCCRETGTLIFKGTFGSSNTMSGKLIFVTNIEEEESPYKFRSTVGTFTASRTSAK